MDKGNKYVVYEGRKPGTYKTWEEAKEQVHGYPGNCHEKVKSPGVAGRTKYVVYEGHNPGVYDKWSHAHKQVSGYPGASYKKTTEK